MWDKITVGKYQELYAIMTDESFENEVDRQVHLLSCMYGHTVVYYEGMRLTDLLEEVKKIAFLSTVEIPKVKPSRYLVAGKHKFKPVYDFRDLAAGQFIDSLSAAKDKEDYVYNLHRLLASISRATKRTWHGRKAQSYCAVPFEQVAELMKQVPIIEANATALFFWNVWEAFCLSMPDFLKQKILTLKETDPERAELWIQVLQAVGAG